jgi:LPS O-antigen subunit length determinant protein (WzzB/FepE family)
MTKEDRLKMIRLLIKGPDADMVLITKSDIKEEIDLAIRSNDDQSIQDDESINIASKELVSQLANEQEETKSFEKELARSEQNDLLTKSERKQVADELWRYRHPIQYWIAPISLFQRLIA